MGAAISIPAPAAGSPVERAFANLDQELVEIRRQLIEVAPRVVGYLIDEWVVELTRRCLRELRGSVEARKQQAQNHVAGFLGERPEDRKARHQAFFAAVEPRALDPSGRIQELTDGLWASYHHAHAELERRSPYGRLLARYRLPEAVVRALLTRALSPLGEAEDAMLAHSKQVNANAEYQKLLAAGAGDPGDEIELSIRRVHASFERLCRDQLQTQHQLQKNLKFALLVLYAGGVRRLAQDLAGLGRELVTLDFEAARLGVRLQPQQEQELAGWARAVGEHLARLEAKGDWASVGALSNLALDYVAADPARRALTPEDDGCSFAVHFARARSRALSAAAGGAWSRGEITLAATLYRRLIAGSNLVCESGADKTPGGESLAVAGMRLALAYTSKKTKSAPSARADVGMFVVQVQQALVRMGADAEAELCATGEALDPQTVRCAQVLAGYAALREIPLLPALGLPGPQRAELERLLWQKDPAQLPMSEIGAWCKRHGASQVKDSELLGWLFGSVRATRRRRLLSGVKYVTLAAVLIGCGTWVKLMYPGLKERYFPTRIAGVLAAPAAPQPGPDWNTLLSRLGPREHLGFAEQAWARVQARQELAPEQLSHVMKHLDAIPAGAAEAQRANLLRAEIERRSVEARTQFVNQARVPYLGGRYALRLVGEDKRTFRVTSPKCSEAGPKQIIDDKGEALRRLGFARVECALWEGSESWSQAL